MKEQIPHTDLRKCAYWAVQWLLHYLKFPKISKLFLLYCKLLGQVCCLLSLFSYRLLFRLYVVVIFVITLYSQKYVGTTFISICRASLNCCFCCPFQCGLYGYSHIWEIFPIYLWQCWSGAAILKSVMPQIGSEADMQLRAPIALICRYQSRELIETLPLAVSHQGWDTNSSPSCFISDVLLIE